jgi:hypothetical protein
MKSLNKITLLSLLVLIANSCASVEKNNASLNDLIPTEKLQADVDFTYKKLKQLHPKLYWYITKEKLDYKFDSLKNSIKAPMKSFEFYKKLSTVTNAVGQGHMYISPKVKLYTKKEIAAVAKKGNGPLSQFDFEIFNNKLYVVKNKSYNKKIPVGSEVVAINGKPTTELIAQYDKFFTSDGYNKTFKSHGIIKRFGTFFTNENGIMDSLKYDFKINDSLKTYVIKRKIVDSTEIKKAKIVLTKAQRKAKSKKNDLLGYDSERKLYMRNLRFMEKDSSIAIIKINGFQKGSYRQCYKQFFETIKKNNSKTLIIDLRNNGGGRLYEINNLYSYLADSSFVFIKPSEVTSKTSLFHVDYFKGRPFWAQPFLVAGAPIFYGYHFFKTHKYPDGKWYNSSNAKPKPLAENNFKGKIYVLINGGSFSASSIISSNLQGSKRAYFVGEETGGAYNGTVAGQMPLVKIPNAGLKVRVGLIVCTPFHQTNVEGRGIFPDKEIIPTLQDRINGVDPELDWILGDIKKS